MTEKHGTANEGRFASLLSGKQPALNIWDTVVFETTEYLVSPTKGSIVTDWLLFIPKLSALNFAQVRDHSGRDPFCDVREVLTEIGVSEYIWFEHGAGGTNSEVGCGVDYAHIHLLIAPEFSLDDFRLAVEASSSDGWLKAKSDLVYKDLDPATDYYAFGDAQQSYWLAGSSLGRQFFRKVVGSLAGKTNEWDYNLFDHSENVKVTIGHFSRLAKAA
jgi:hypothetical protein